MGSNLTGETAIASIVVVLFTMLVFMAVFMLVIVLRKSRTCKHQAHQTGNEVTLHNESFGLSDKQDAEVKSVI